MPPRIRFVPGVALVLSILLSGCYTRGSLGYARTLESEGNNLVNLELAAGFGDLREPSEGLWPEAAEVSTRLSAANPGRVGLGGSLLWAPSAGWEQEWTPTIRVGLYPVQMEIRDDTSSLGDYLLSATGFVELGLLSYSTQERQSRGIFTAGLGFEYTHLFGAPSRYSSYPAVFLLLGWGYSLSSKPGSQGATGK
jgi:hypothetical protein